MSKIFDWYKEDFHNGVVGFFMKYAKGDLLKRLRDQRSQVEVAYLDYDWSLNGK